MYRYERATIVIYKDNFINFVHQSLRGVRWCVVFGRKYINELRNFNFNVIQVDQADQAVN